MLDERADLLELGRRIMREHKKQRQALEREVERVWCALERVSVAFVETLEHLEGLLEADSSEEAARFALRQAQERIEDAGIGLDGAYGEPFDPKRHRAIEDRTTSERGELVVVSVLSHGITCAGRRFRPADVVVRRSSARGEP